ncbi:MAG: AbrB/MazE/SpoVT family DNA-binding domain-containing protein [Clostridia bacterium]
MKNSGIVRRLDELGRIVIPKELRRTLRIKDGDELEISVNDDKLVLRKYSAIESVEPAAKAAAKMLSEATGADVLFLDSAKVVIADGKNRSAYQNAELTEKFADMLLSRKSLVLHGDDAKDLFLNTTPVYFYICIEPILVGGDLIGSLCVALDTMPSDLARAYLKFVATMFEAVLS